MGLNESFSHVRAQILMMKPLPPLTKAFSLVVQEERQRTIGQFHVSDSMVVAESTINSVTSSGSSMIGKQNRRDRFFYTYSKMKGHSRERCYKIIGYPSTFKNHAKTGAGQSSGSSDVSAQINHTFATSGDSQAKYDVEHSMQSLSADQF